MRKVAAAVIASLTLAGAASAQSAPVASVAEDGGGQGTTCRWFPYWQLVCSGDCYWVGRFEWYADGYPTGRPCA